MALGDARAKAFEGLFGEGDERMTDLAALAEAQTSVKILTPYFLPDNTLVTALTDQHEAARPTPWKVTDAPPPYVTQMIAAIVGFEIEVDWLEGKFKASQNRNASDRAGVREGLEATGHSAADVAELLRSPNS